MWLRLAPKLSDAHILNSGFDKMRVSLAAQVFSRSVSAGVYTHAVLGALPEEAINTATFLNNVDELLDVLTVFAYSILKSKRILYVNITTKLYFN